MNLSHNPPLITNWWQQLSKDETLDSVTEDGAYNTPPAYETVLKQGAISPSFSLVRMQACAGVLFGDIAMRLVPHADGWAKASASDGEWLPPTKFGGNQDNCIKIEKANDVLYL